ncbi:MAG: aldolase/citrate lyase family protein, partial [Pseudomonadota bacterium]
MGTFLKTPSSIVAEVLSITDLDVFCVDAEHAPFGPLETDQCIAAFRAADAPSLVRVADDSSTAIRSALDCGATGVLVPHVTTAQQAAAIVKAAHFGDGGRGFAGSPRAAGYTTRSMQQYMADSAEQTTVIVQIEDLAALDNVAEIAAVPGVDAIFVGRIDLAVAMSCSPMDDAVVAAIQKVCDDAKGADAAVGMFTPDLSEIPMWRDKGTSLFL